MVSNVFTVLAKIHGKNVTCILDGTSLKRVLCVAYVRKNLWYSLDVVLSIEVEKYLFISVIIVF